MTRTKKKSDRYSQDLRTGRGEEQPSSSFYRWLGFPGGAINVKALAAATKQMTAPIAAATPKAESNAGPDDAITGHKGCSNQSASTRYCAVQPGCCTRVVAVDGHQHCCRERGDRTSHSQSNHDHRGKYPEPIACVRSDPHRQEKAGRDDDRSCDQEPSWTDLGRQGTGGRRCHGDYQRQGQERSAGLRRGVSARLNQHIGHQDEQSAESAVQQECQKRQADEARRSEQRE